MKLLDEKQIIELYSKGQGLREIGKLFGCSYSPIKRVLLKNNIELRKRGGTKGKPNKGAFKPGNTPWNKELKGIHLSPDSEFKKGIEPWNKGIFNNKRYLLNQIRDCDRGKSWRYKIYKRDNNTCQLCNFYDRGHEGFIVAHHIYRLKQIIDDFNIESMEDTNTCSILWDTNNGVCLCKDCHKKVHSRRGWSSHEAKNRFI